MEQNKKMEVFANLTKHITIASVEEKVLPGSLVFEALNQFPGYYHETPTSAQPFYIYLVLDKQYPLEEVLRATQNIEKEYDWDFDSGKGYMIIGSQLLNVIRVRHLPELDLVEKIQEAYQNQGIHFLMNKKLSGKLEAEVKIVKFLVFEKLADGVYVESQDHNFGYIEIPKYLSYDAFVKVTMDVKYNWEGHEFDAASGSFFKEGKLFEFVRILSNKIDTDYLVKLRKLYLEKIR
ncbi:hypothetical protein D1164_07925 [Mariniphaga sediminis]|jgi:hypothetical protein|uniref:Uncharacterized protein n=1 Tax=Mariniphaga sediminis TaxID=1628158 RepID=A0A399D2Z0_9BACT|nr:hypothetical protein [Mariniphaga sediminis]RIH65588.1 hypothetical protein D1164_07925 [Mariniphaga sediminis]